MSRSRFVISSLLLAGFSHPAEAQDGGTIISAVGGDANKISDEARDLFRGSSAFQLAGHRSHSSHSSHSSHRSSTGGGGSYSPAPVYRPPSKPAPARVYTPVPIPARVAVPKSVPLYTTPSPSSEQYSPNISGTGSEMSRLLSPREVAESSTRAPFTIKVKQVQRGLLAYGYYKGDIDGVVGASTKKAIQDFQQAFSLPVTGSVTPEVLKALGLDQ